MVFAERTTGIVILLLSLVSDVFFLIATIRGFRLLEEWHKNGRYFPGSLELHKRALIIAIATMLTMIVIILAAIRVFSLPLTPFYFSVHRRLIRLLTVFLAGALFFNGKRFRRAHLLFAPSVWLLYTAAAITGDMLVIPLFLGK